MASALSPEENEQKCTICFHIKTAYRKLPGCMHSFCEDCLLTFMSALKRENRLESEFACPVCKRPSLFPKGKSDILEVVRTMELLDDTKNEMKDKPNVEDARSTNSQCCSQCNFGGKSVTSERFCHDCHEYFCEKCSEILHSFRVNKNHYVINTDELKRELFQAEAFRLFEKFVTCPAHPDQQVMFHCLDDDQLFCVLCAPIKHRNCRDVKCINDVVRQNLETETFKLSEVVIKMEKHIQNIKSTIKENEPESKKSLESIEQDIQETKQKVIKLLDEMEENLIQAGKAIVKEIAIKDLDDIQELDQLTFSLQSIQYIVDKIVTKISDEQAYICLHEAKQTVNHVKKTLNRKWAVRQKHGIKVNKERILESMQDLGINETSKLASVYKTEMPVSLPVYHEESDLTVTAVKRISTHHIVPKDKEPQPTYDNVVFLPSKQFLLTDSYNGCCYLVNEKLCIIGCYKADKHAKLVTQGNEFSNRRYASYMKNGMLAISVPDKKKICVVTANERLTYKGEIRCAYTPMALCVLVSGDIAISWDNPVAFGIISGPIWQNEKVYFTSDKSGRLLKSFYYLAVDEKRRHVIQPCVIDKAVYGFEFDGQPVFEYRHEALKDPKGVAVDGLGNIYVCEVQHVCVHILSPAGQGIRIIEDGCPRKPLGIGFKDDGKIFAVTGYYYSWYDVHFFSVVSEKAMKNGKGTT